jgi:mRNA interferase RelE/StbE
VVKKYSVRFTSEAIQYFRRLDRTVAELVFQKIKWFSENRGLVSPLPLQNNLKGKYKLRAGDWRVIYELDEKAGEMTVLFAGHRREVHR